MEIIPKPIALLFNAGLGLRNELQKFFRDKPDLLLPALC